MTRTLTAAAAALAALSGCMTMSSPQAAASMPDLQLCARAYSLLKGGIYGHAADEIARAEIRRRNLLTADEWALVEARKVSIGMSECALRASWGIPTKINDSAGPWGSARQYVYRTTGYYTSSASYVYVRDGTVEAWQN